MKKIYRGYYVHQLDVGAWVVIAPVSQMLMHTAATEELAYNWIDERKKEARGGTKEA